jgi:putative glycosyltransferase (TIGR04372 family)
VQARWRGRLAGISESFWRELYRELRRHAGDERLPYDLRGRLRSAAQRALDRSHRDAASAPFPRMRVRTHVDAPLPERLAHEARAAAERLGLAAGQPFVAAAVRGRDAAFHESVAMLDTRGFAVVRLQGPASRDSGATHGPALDTYLLRSCAFLLCDNVDAQQLAYVTNTPTLTVNATDAFMCYPIREHGIYLLKTAIDLDTGRVLTPHDFLSEGYYRNLRNIGYRDNTRDQIRAAVGEMLEGLTHGWRESDAQKRYRTAAVAAGEALATRFQQVARWAPLNGFIGDGRLARIQAEEVA